MVLVDVDLEVGTGDARVRLDVGHALLRQHILAEEAVPRPFAAAARDDGIRCVGVDLGPARPRDCFIASHGVLHGLRLRLASPAHTVLDA